MGFLDRILADRSVEQRVIGGVPWRLIRPWDSPYLLQIFARWADSSVPGVLRPGSGTRSSGTLFLRPVASRISRQPANQALHTSPRRWRCGQVLGTVYF